MSKKGTSITIKKALWQTVFWVGLSIAFCGFLWFEKTPIVATKYFAAYLMEWSLSIDNIFVFILIFTYFKVQEQDAARALLIGILLAIVFRIAFIAVGNSSGSSKFMACQNPVSCSIFSLSSSLSLNVFVLASIISAPPVR